MTKHIALLKGGLSNEREVSLSSAEAVGKALNKLGYQVTEIDVGRDISQKLCEIKPDIAFNALHGTYGEDGSIQGILEFLQIPYTHSGVLASSAAMNKELAKHIFSSIGIVSAKGGVFWRKDILKNDVIKRPYIVKPISEGSSVGVYLVENDIIIDENAPNFPKGERLLVEKYIEGRELTVGVLDKKAMGVIEINPHAGFYDYKNKYLSGMTDYIIPAPLDEKTYDKAMELALLAHDVFGCRGVSRTDFRLSLEGELFALEINTHPGMTSTSLVPKLANYIGVSFEELIDKLVNSAQLDNS